VYVIVNEHRNYGENAGQCIAMNADLFKRTAPDVVTEMIKRDSVVQVKVYPDDPNTALVTFHFDLDIAIEEAIENLQSYRHQVMQDMIRNKEGGKDV
jgi:Na+/H+-translocating membrane pyrophosphatase